MLSKSLIVNSNNKENIPKKIPFKQIRVELSKWKSHTHTHIAVNQTKSIARFKLQKFPKAKTLERRVKNTREDETGQSKSFGKTAKIYYYSNKNKNISMTKVAHSYIYTFFFLGVFFFSSDIRLRIFGCWCVMDAVWYSFIGIIFFIMKLIMILYSNSLVFCCICIYIYRQ